jgi:hypothetical protein
MTRVMRSPICTGVYVTVSYSDYIYIRATKFPV